MQSIRKVPTVSNVAWCVCLSTVGLRIVSNRHVERNRAPRHTDHTTLVTIGGGILMLCM